jgi:hypothetical protein
MLLPSKSARKTIHVLLPRHTNTVGRGTAWDMLQVRHACAEARTCVRALLLRDRHPLPTATPHATFSYTPDVIPRPRAHSLPFFCVNIESVYHSFVRSRPRSSRRPSVRDLHPHPLQAKPVSTAAVVPCFPTLAVEAAGAVQRCPLRDTLEKSLTASSHQLSIHRHTTSTPRSTSEQRV